MHWSCKYLGISYLKFDCSEFVAFVLKKELGINFNFPVPERDQKIRAKKIFDSYLDFVYPEKTESPEDFDAIILSGTHKFSHIGLFFKNSGTDYILHSSARTKKVVNERICDLKLFGMTLEGFYKWRR